jgi:hypothetical protein
MDCAEGATGTRKPFKAEKSWKSAPDSVYRRNAIAVACIFACPENAKSICNG